MSMLESIKILKDLNKEELENLEPLCQERFLKKWEILFNKWDDANSIYLLKSGEIEVYTEKDKEEIILWFVKAEDILWEMALFKENKKRMASAKAVKDTVVIILLEFALNEIISKHPEVAEKIKNIIKQREWENKIIL